jgi:hypothetical protein
MPPFSLINLEYVFSIIGVGLIIAFLVILARATPVWSFTFKKRSDREIEQDIHEFGSGVTERNQPIPWLIWVVLCGWFAWAAAYSVYVSSTGY